MADEAARQRIEGIGKENLNLRKIDEERRRLFDLEVEEANAGGILHTSDLTHLY